MKKVILLFAVLLLTSLFCCRSASALDEEYFDREIHRIEDSLDKDTADAMEEMDINGIEGLITNGVNQKKIWSYVLDLITSNSKEPISVLLVLIAILMLASVAESYTYSLRYIETKEIMSVAVSLFLTSVCIGPVGSLVASEVDVIQGASSVMTAYLPIAAGIMAFSGHAIASGGYYVAVVTAAGFISRFASSVLSPLLNIVLSLSVSAGICSRIRLNGLIDMFSKGFKYGLTFVMSVFVAVLGLNSVLTTAADSVADKAAKFSLSSFIPLVGASVSEAYGAIQNSVNLLRSGAGVFVIMAIFIAFAPLLLRTILWSAVLGIGKTAGEAFSVTSGMAVLDALSRFLSALRAVLIAVMTAFVISSAVMLSLGGRS